MSFEKGILFQVQLMKSSLVTAGRNLCVSHFLNSDFTHMLFIDSDILFYTDSIFKMIEKDVDIIRNFIKNNNVTLPTFEGSAKIYDKAEKTLSKNWDTASVYEVLKMENIDE